MAAVTPSIHLERADAKRCEVECFIDLCCPFSAKMFLTLVEADLSPPGFRLTFQHTPQPWHAQSSYMHEAALCVNLVQPDAYMPSAPASPRARAPRARLFCS